MSARSFAVSVYPSTVTLGDQSSGRAATFQISNESKLRAAFRVQVLDGQSSGSLKSANIQIQPQAGEIDAGDVVDITVSLKSALKLVEGESVEFTVDAIARNDINKNFDLTSLWSLFSVTPDRHKRSETIRCIYSAKSSSPVSLPEPSLTHSQTTPTPSVHLSELQKHSPAIPGQGSKPLVRPPPPPPLPNRAKDTHYSPNAGPSPSYVDTHATSHSPNPLLMGFHAPPTMPSTLPGASTSDTVGGDHRPSPSRFRHSPSPSVSEGRPRVPSISAATPVPRPRQESDPSNYVDLPEIQVSSNGKLEEIMAAYHDARRSLDRLGALLQTFPQLAVTMPINENGRI
ncbi:hypothetical protein SISNIDRAFT_454058 [Sistotremastrum niveocremeum HHB9708]|uniref:MSP domain-containing protein n=1 Tax=Sistotremastrum niveocremeum HHB9708 TaxID=1314777 RepID=A0A164UY03_9AGAM|nr:hypothetical protein SISNIDRAFT_454058 [Sistotremastrum niveocremeum HHB9708]